MSDPEPVARGVAPTPAALRAAPPGQPTGTPSSVADPAAPGAPAAEADPLVAPEPVADADPRVVDALSRLDELTDLPLAEQVQVFTDVHRRLAAVLADPASRG